MKTPPHREPCPHCGRIVVPPRDLDPSVEAKLVKLVPQNPMEAINRLRTDHGWTLGEAKEWVLHLLPKRASPKPLCPRCGHPLASDLARQCLSCGMDWHDAEPAEPGPGAQRTTDAPAPRRNDELDRVRNGSAQPLGGDRYIVHCDGKAADVIRRSREVLEAVRVATTSGWPTDGDWPRLLPAWFVAKCAPEMSREEDERALAEWRAQGSREWKRPWSLLAWLHWFKPGQRAWFWWDATIESDKKAVVTVESHEPPWGSLEWLLLASGAREVVPEEE
jgi:hypothetical protein